MFIIRPRNSSIVIPREPPGPSVSDHTFEHTTVTGDNRLPTVDGSLGTLLLAPGANYNLQGHWVFGAGPSTGFQHTGSFACSVYVDANGVPTVTGYTKYNETFSGMDLTVLFNSTHRRPEIVLRTYLWGTAVTRALVSLKVIEIVRNSQP